MQTFMLQKEPVTIEPNPYSVAQRYLNLDFKQSVLFGLPLACSDA